jgi:nitrate/nitrite-specific signal transduction histidine kinase
MADYNRLQTTGILVMVAVLLLLLLICRLVIDRNLKPLDLLSVKVRRITQNRFDEPIPTNNRQDEIGELQRSFSAMQQALASHLSEMHQKTAELQDRNVALQAAYERGLEDERIKTAFLNSISEQIMVPVNDIYAATDRLSDSYQRLTKEEMSRLQQQISTHIDTITSLIDQTLITSQNATAVDDSSDPKSSAL